MFLSAVSNGNSWPGALCDFSNFFCSWIISVTWSSSTNTMSTFYPLSLPTNEVLAESTAIGLLACCVIKIDSFYYLGSQGHLVLILLILKVSHYFVSSAHFIITAHIFVPTSLMEISGWIKVFWCFRWVCDPFFPFISNVETSVFIASFSLAAALISFVRKLSWASGNSHFILTLLNIFQAIILFHSLQAFDCSQ